MRPDLKQAMRRTKITSALWAPFWAPVVVGILAGLMLWTTGLSAALGSEGDGEASNNDGKGTAMITFEKAEGYALNTPFYAVADMERSMVFYVEAFGLTLGNVMRGDDGAAFHGELAVNDETVLMIGPEGSPEAPHGLSPNSGGYKASFNSYFYVSDVGAFVARAAAAGAEVVEEPADQFWGDRTAYLKDPDGYLWMIATKIAKGEGEGTGESEGE